jgi:hypothetical protein
MELTDDERKAVLRSVRSTIDLWRRYCSLRPYDGNMKAKQSRLYKPLGLLRTAETKLREKEER